MATTDHTLTTVAPTLRTQTVPLLLGSDVHTQQLGVEIHEQNLAGTPESTIVHDEFDFSTATPNKYVGDRVHLVINDIVWPFLLRSPIITWTKIKLAIQLYVNVNTCYSPLLAK